MIVSRLRNIPGIGVNVMGDAADALNDPDMLRLENLDTDIVPPVEALSATQQSIKLDSANSYLPFFGIDELRKAAVIRVQQDSDVNYKWNTECVISAGGLSGILNVLLALIEVGDEVIITDPAYAGLLNRIRLAGGIPKLVPLIIHNNGWRMDIEKLNEAASHKTKAILTMSPSMPTGIVHNKEEWNAIAELVQKTDAWLIHDAAMQRIVFDGIENIHPASMPNLTERTISIGSVSKEYRMIGWRIGWIVGPEHIMTDIGLVSLSNVVCQVGIGMPGAAAAILSEDDGILGATTEWEQRRNHLMNELSDLPVIKPDGGWSLLIDTKELGMPPKEAANQCFEFGGIAATPMNGWGSKEVADKYLRFVFANEPVNRLHDIRDRLRTAWGV